MQCNFTNFSTHVVNEYYHRIDVTYLISGIYTNFCRLLCTKVCHRILCH